MIINKQKGAALMISLVLLMVMTLLALASTKMVRMEVKSTGNYQHRSQVEGFVQEAIEDKLSTINNFDTPLDTTFTVLDNDSNSDGAVDSSSGSFNVTVTEPNCFYTEPATGYSATWALKPDQTVWEITGSATDPITGSVVSMTQGVAIKLPAGTCN